MKFANQQSHLFVDGGGAIAYMLGLHKFINMIAAQFINIYMLTYQPSVELSIIHFVALEVIVHFTHLYMEALMDDKLTHVAHHLPKADRRGVDINFSERTCFHKMARILYKILRAFYVSCIFYFVPYAILFVFWSTPASAPTV